MTSQPTNLILGPLWVTEFLKGSFTIFENQNHKHLSKFLLLHYGIWRMDFNTLNDVQNIVIRLRNKDIRRKFTYVSIEVVSF